MSKVLVVGGAGYVGGWLTDELLSAGHDVVVFDSLLYEDTYLKDVPLIRGDVRDHEAIASTLAGVDAVVWLAAIVGDPACALDPQTTRDVNLESLRFLLSHYDGRVLFPSTCSVYGAQDGVLTEESPLAPLSLYAETKIDAEELLSRFPARSMVFRLGTLFGIGDAHSRLRTDLVVNVLAIRAVLAGRMSVYGGRQFRPLLHVRDVATAIVPNVGSEHTGVFNLHCENLTILEVAERIKREVPDASIQLTEMSFQDSRNYSVSSDKAVSAFGFSPRYSVDEGIRQIVAVVREGRISDLSAARFSNLEALRPQLTVESSPLGRLTRT